MVPLEGHMTKEAGGLKVLLEAAGGDGCVPISRGEAQLLGCMGGILSDFQVHWLQILCKVLFLGVLLSYRLEFYYHRP